MNNGLYKVKVRCQKCKGKGHKPKDWAYVVIPFLFLDAENPDAISRKTCGNCKGRGYHVD